MRSALGLVLIGVAVVVLIILSSATFVVLQTEQALVLRFGEPVAGRGLPALATPPRSNAPAALPVKPIVPATPWSLEPVCSDRMMLKQSVI